MARFSSPRFTGRSVAFGDFSRFRAREFSTRFGTVVWFVTDAESVDEATGLLEVVAQADSLEAAQAAVGC